MPDNGPAAALEPVTLGELPLILGAGADTPVMFRALGVTFTCTAAGMSHEEGRYVLMLDGETCD